MKFLIACIFLLAFLSVVNFGKASKPPKNNLLAGTAKVLITPQTPIPMSGYGGRDDPFKGVHDDIYARVIVLSDGVNKAVLITTELIGISNTIWEETTFRITKETDINRDYILLSAVHNHSGPVIKVYNGEDSSANVVAYIAELENKFVNATKEALKNMVPVSIGAGKGECKMNINRRAPNGKGEIELGQNPYAPCDHEVGAISINKISGEPIAIITNWPCHGVVLGPRNYLITGDWPGAASRYLEENSGNKLVAPVIIGASGDINPIYGPHIDFETNNSYAFGKDAIGEDLGKESLRIIKTIKPFSSGKITALQKVISLPAKDRAKEDGNTLQPRTKEDDSLKVRLTAIKIGNIILTGVSGEVFNQISVKMRKRSSYPFTFMITHCNGSSGYLVSDDAYPKPGVSRSENKYIPTGGYEAGSTRAKSGAEKGIIENLLDMISKL